MNKQHFLCIVFTCLAAAATAQQYANEYMMNKYEFLANNIYGIARSGDNYYFAGSFKEGFGVPNANKVVRFNVKTNTFSKVGPSLNDDVLEIAGTAHGFVARGIFDNVGGDENVSEIAYYNEATNTMTGLPGKKGVGFHYKKDDPYRMLGIGTDVFIFAMTERLDAPLHGGSLDLKYYRHPQGRNAEAEEDLTKSPVLMSMIQRFDGSKPELPSSLVVPDAYYRYDSFIAYSDDRGIGLGYVKDTLFVIGDYYVREKNPTIHKPAEAAASTATPTEQPKKKGGLLGKLGGSGGSSSSDGGSTKKLKFDGNTIMSDFLGYDLKNNVWFPIIPSLTERKVNNDHPVIESHEVLVADKFFSKHGGKHEGGVVSIVKIGGTYYFGGTFSEWGGDASGQNVISWNGTAFNTMDEGLDRGIDRLYAANGTLYAFGAFSESGTKTPLPGLAMWDATNKKWTTVGGLGRQFKQEGGWQTVNGVKKPQVFEQDTRIRWVSLVGDDLLVSGFFSFKDANGKLIVNFARFDTKAKKWYAVLPVPPAAAPAGGK